jgi:hypothetical protein
MLASLAGRRVKDALFESVLPSLARPSKGGDLKWRLLYRSQQLLDLVCAVLLGVELQKQ